jgi:hypothetical protein
VAQHPPQRLEAFGVLEMRVGDLTILEEDRALHVDGAGRTEEDPEHGGLSSATAGVEHVDEARILEIAGPKRSTHP